MHRSLVVWCGVVWSTALFTVFPPETMTQFCRQKWIAYSNWTYTRKFTVAPALLAARVVQLVSLGVDTIADIYINNVKIVHTDNMFQRLRFDVKHALTVGSNSMRVEFYSKVRKLYKAKRPFYLV
jgi:beta-mannosidase